jgi:hypothetical protein
MNPVAAPLADATARVQRWLDELAEQGQVIEEPKYRCLICRDDPRGQKPSGGFNELGRPVGRMVWCECRSNQRARKVVNAIAKDIDRNWRGWSLDRLRPHVPATAMAEFEGYVDFYIGHIFGDFELEPLDEFHPGDGLWLVGPSGSAKTAAAASIVQEISSRMRSRDPARWRHEWRLGWWSFDELLDHLRGTMDDDAKISTLQFINGLRDVDLLVLDDLAATHIKEWGAARLYSILNSRMANAKPTIVTTDVDEDTLAQIFSTGRERQGGDRIVRRLQDFTVQVELPERVFTGPQRRSFAAHRIPADQRPAKPEDPFDVDERPSTYGRPPA